MYGSWDGLDSLLTGLGAAALLGAAVGVFAIAQPHDVDYYYLHQEPNNAVCVYSHWTWHADEAVYCSTDPSKPLEFLEIANSTLPATKGSITILQPESKKSGIHEVQPKENEQ
jgi:hypothetical protein